MIKEYDIIATDGIIYSYRFVGTIDELYNQIKDKGYLMIYEVDDEISTEILLPLHSIVTIEVEEAIK